MLTALVILGVPVIASLLLLALCRLEDRVNREEGKR